MPRLGPLPAPFIAAAALLASSIRPLNSERVALMVLIRSVKALAIARTDEVSAVTPVLDEAIERACSPPIPASESAITPPSIYFAIPPYGTKTPVCELAFAALILK
jgi:hypothetical protein